MIGTIHTDYRIRGLLAFFLITTPLFAADNSPPPPKKVTIAGKGQTPSSIAKSIKAQTGIEIDVSALDDKPVAVDFQKIDFWNAIERVASETASHPGCSGGRISLKPGKSKTPSFISGPFRFSFREVTIHGDGESGLSSYTIAIDVMWEPWLNTYRVDTKPKISSAKDDAGNSITIAPGGSRTFTSGNAAALTVHSQGVTRSAKVLSLSGSIMMTIADKLLTFTFDAATGKAIGPGSQEGVSVNIDKHGPESNDWVATVELHYPKSEVLWESHEYAWHRNNVMRLLPPKGEPIVADLVEPADLRYGFKGRAKQVGTGWKLDYRTPGPMREIVVPFELKDIRLP